MGQEAGTVSASSLNPGQAKVSKQLSPYLTSRIGKAMTAYPGQLTSPMTGLETLGYGGIEDFLRTGQMTGFAQPALYKEREASLRQALTGKPLYEISPGATEAYFQQSIAEPELKRFREQILPSIGETFEGQPGAYWSSARMGQERKAGSDLAEFLIAKKGELVYKDIQAQREAQDLALQRALATQGLAQGYGAEPLGWAQEGIQIGALERAIKDQAAYAQYQEWMRTQPEMSPVIGQALQYLGIPMLSQGYQPGTDWAGLGVGAGTSILTAMILASALGPAGAAAAAGAAGAGAGSAASGK